MRRGLRRGRLGQCRRVGENSWLFEEVGRDGFVGLAKALCCVDLFWGCDVPHSREGNGGLFYPPDLPSLCIGYESKAQRQVSACMQFRGTGRLERAGYDGDAA